MKFFILSFFILCSFQTFCQNKKNSVLYRGDQITIDILENRLASNEKLLSRKVYGTEVEISVDTIFKSYHIEFSDENYKRVQMTLKYVQDYYPSNGADKDLSKLYLMTCQETRFFLIDYLEMPLINQLSFSYIDGLSKNQTPVFFIRDVKKAN